MFEPGGPTFFELTHQALVSTHRGYELLAPKFDHTPFRTPAVLLDPVERFLAHNGPVGDALDVCCGTGAATARLRRLTTGRVVGFDFSAGMLAQAERAVPDAEFHEGDARALPYHRDFDLAVSFGAFGHFRVHEQPAFLAGIFRALRPGGRFVFITAQQPPLLHPRALVYRAFNLVMRIRNRILKPKFVMYYLNFLLPEAQQRLEDAGFQVTIQDLDAQGPFPRAKLVVATRPKGS